MTRGIRNNNPLNIRISDNDWKGKAFFNFDGKFEQFISMYYGFRAAILTIETYILKYECNTICKIVARWAPAADGNNTDNYIKYVCSATGIGGNEVISNTDKRLKLIIAAMAYMESGKEIQDYIVFLDRAFDDYEPRGMVYNKSTKVYDKT